MKRTLGYLALGVILTAVACDGRDESGMELRTFELERMNMETAEPLLTPYIREGGTLSGRGNMITVREAPERLDRIAEILARYDRPPRVRVVVYVLEAGDFENASGLPFEPTLRELLPYRGYRLLDDAMFSTTEWSDFSREGGSPFAIEGRVQEVRAHQADGSAVIELAVEGRTEARLGERIRSTVSAPFGETIVVASHRSDGEGPALIVALRVSLTTTAGAALTAAGDSVGASE